MCTGGFAQHYPVYSQYMFNGLTINPAYAGSRDVLSISGSTRNQWIGFKGAPKTQFLSAHLPVMKKRIGLGLQLINDKIGVTHHTSLQLNYAYRFPIKKGMFSMGLSTSLQFLSSYWEDVETTAPNDLVFMENYHETAINFGVGLYYQTPKYYIGFSSPFLFPYCQEIYLTDSVNLRSQNYFLTAGYVFKLDREWSIKPSFLFKVFPEKTAQLDLNCNLIYNDVLWTGISLRTEDAIVWMFEFKVLPQLQLGYAHDFTISTISTYSNGTNEVFLRYELGNKTDAKSIKYF